MNDNRATASSSPETETSQSHKDDVDGTDGSGDRSGVLKRRTLETLQRNEPDSLASAASSPAAETLQSQNNNSNNGDGNSDEGEEEEGCLAGPYQHQASIDKVENAKNSPIIKVLEEFVQLNQKLKKNSNAAIYFKAARILTAVEEEITIQYALDLGHRKIKLKEVGTTVASFIHEYLTNNGKIAALEDLRNEANAANDNVAGVDSNNNTIHDGKRVIILDGNSKLEEFLALQVEHPRDLVIAGIIEILRNPNFPDNMHLPHEYHGAERYKDHPVSASRPVIEQDHEPDGVRPSGSQAATENQHEKHEPDGTAVALPRDNTTIRYPEEPSQAASSKPNNNA